jgi:hypothetical protein
MFPVKSEYHLLVKIKAIPLTGREGLYSGTMLWIPDFLDNRRTGDGNVVSLKHWQPSTSQKHFLFLSLVPIEAGRFR